MKRFNIDEEICDVRIIKSSSNSSEKQEVEVMFILTNFKGGLTIGDCKKLVKTLDRIVRELKLTSLILRPAYPMQFSCLATRLETTKEHGDRMSRVLEAKARAEKAAKTRKAQKDLRESKEYERLKKKFGV